MARVEASAEDGGYRLAGAYAKLLWKQCYRRPDPRLIHDVDSGQRKRVEAEGRSDATVMFEGRLRAGEPLRVARCVLGGHSVPVPRDVPMFRDRSVTGWIVHPDDTIRPTRIEP